MKSTNLYKTYKIKKTTIISKILISITITILLLLLAIYILKTFVYPLKHFDIITKEAAENNLDPYLVISIIKTESSFNKYATSNKQAKGLMQIMDSTASDVNEKLETKLDESDIYNENVNIALGCNYFSSLVNKYNGNIYLAICAYNAGMGNVDKWIEEGIVSKDLNKYKDIDIPFSQTKNYLYKVITTYKTYRFLYK